VSDRRMRSVAIVVALVVIVVVAAVVLSAWVGTWPRSPEQREAAARELLLGIHVSATVASSSLAAAHAIADFGLQEGVRLVRVRIVEGLALELRVESTHTVVFAEPPLFCLVGPFSAPDDAGLSDRCWGEPDLGVVVAGGLPSDQAGHPMFPAGAPATLSATLQRGDVRCDYPPGKWVLEVKVDPLVDGTAMGARYLPDVGFEVPFATPAPLTLLSQTRYCGLASVVYREQGEPPVVNP
jgi:hypothetical protein